jgi:hypothetical protein
MLERTKGDFWRRGRSWGLAILATSASLTFVSSAHAQDAQSTAAAEALFDEARKLMTEGKVADACPKLEESERLAPAVGTLLNLGVCYEKSHRIASAWATFKEAISAARASGQSEREQLARTHAQALEGKISTLTIRMPFAVEAVPGVEVRRDGVVVARAAWGSAMPLDAGPHRVDVTAPGHSSWSSTVTLAAEGDKASIDIPPLTIVQPKTTRKLIATAPHQASDTHVSSGSGQRVVGLVVSGLGLAGIATGGIFGVLAKSKNDDALTNHCGGGSFCDAEGLTLTNEARTSATVSTISFAAGGVALITGTVIFFTAPARSQTRSSARASIHASPSFSAHSAGFSFGGTW